METSLRFNAEINNTRIKESLRELDEDSKNYAKRALERDIDSIRIKKDGEKSILDLIEKQINIKSRQADITALEKKTSLRQEMSSEIKEAGSNISSYQRKSIERKYSKEFDNINQVHDTEKQTLEIQKQILSELKKRGENLASTPEGRAQLEGLNMNEADPETFISAAYGKSIMPTGSKMGGLFSSIIGKIGGYLGPAAIAMGAWSLFKSSQLSAAGAETGEDYNIKMKKNLWDLIPLLGLGDILTAGEQRYRQSRTAFNKEAALTYGISGEVGQKFDWGTSYGMTSTQLHPMYRQLMQATFSDPKFLEGVISSKGIGIDQNTSMGLASLGAMNRSNFATTSGILMQNLQSGEVDQSMTQNIMGAVVSLANTQKNTLNMVNTDPIMGAALALRKVGGSFATDLSGRMNTINNALTNPTDDYQKIMSYDILSNLDGVGNSWIDIEMAKEKGIAQNGYLSATMKKAIGLGGGSKTGAVMNLVNRIQGLSVTDANALYETFQSNPEMFDNLDQFNGDEDAVMNYLTKKGKKATSPEEKAKSLIDEAFIKSVKDGMDAVKTLARIADGSSSNKKIETLPPGLDGKNKDGKYSYIEAEVMMSMYGIKS